MAYVAADWTIDRETGNIRYIGDDHGGGAPSYATVIEAHRAWQALADDAVAAGDDELDITNSTPSNRQTDNIIELINGYNIDDTAAEHLYNGSIIQDGGATIYDGIVNFGNADVQLQIIQNGAVLADDWWNFGGGGLNADSANGISHRFMLKVRSGGTDIDGRRLVGTARRFGYTYAEFKINGSSRGNNVLAISDVTDLNNQTASGTVATYDQFANDNQGYNGMDVNNDTTNEYYYSRWDIGGGATPASPSINDLYEYTKYLTRDGSAATLYGISGELFRGITHEITVDTPTGTFSAFEAVSWTGGTGQMLAINSTTAATKMWIQLLTGVPPTDNQTITGGTSSATCLVNVTVTERPIATPFIGQSTGSAIIGAYGVGISNEDLSASDSVTDLTATPITPPNNVTFTVSGVVSGEDRVKVTPLGYRFAYDTEVGGPFTVGETLTFTSPAGTAVLADLYDNGTTGYMYIGEMLTGSVPTDNSTITGGSSSATASVNGSVSQDTYRRQMTLNGALTGAAVTSVVVNGSIPTDTPATGDIRIKRADGSYTEHAYSAWSGSTFTISSTDFSTNNAANGGQVYIAYIDKLATSTSETFTVVYNASRNLFVRVRDGGASPIKTFETSATLGSAGGSSTVIRTSDV